MTSRQVWCLAISRHKLADTKAALHVEDLVLWHIRSLAGIELGELLLKVVDVLAPCLLKTAGRRARDPEVDGFRPGEAQSALGYPGVKGTKARDECEDGHGQHRCHKLPSNVKACHIVATVEDDHRAQNTGGVQGGACVLTARTRACEQRQAHSERRVAAVTWLCHTAGVDARDQGEGHDALPAEDLPVGQVLVDRGTVEASGACGSTVDEVTSARHQPSRHPGPDDGANDLENNVDQRVDEGIEAADGGAEAHSRVQVTAADVGSNIDPHGQREAVHEGCKLRS